jgi:hypothetical protein
MTPLRERPNRFRLAWILLTWAWDALVDPPSLSFEYVDDVKVKGRKDRR